MYILYNFYKVCVIKNNRLIPSIFKRFLRDYTQDSLVSVNTINWFWLSGFVQGDGSFVIRKSSLEYVLYISQHIDDIQLLYKIRNFVGCGLVRTQVKENMAHYVLQNKKGLIFVLKNLCFMFGEKFINQYFFLQRYSLFFALDFIQFDCLCNCISFKNAWLSGFIDAKGSFYGSYNKHNKTLSGYQLQLRFAITQKDPTVLYLIAKLFGDVRVKYNKKGFYYFIISDVLNLDRLVGYIKLFPLLSKKSISFSRWLKLYVLFKNKKHLTLSPLALKRSVSLINVTRDKDIVQPLCE